MDRTSLCGSDDPSSILGGSTYNTKSRHESVWAFVLYCYLQESKRVACEADEVVGNGGVETMRFFKNLFVGKSREVADS